MIAPAGSVALPAPPSAPSVSAASADDAGGFLQQVRQRQRVFLVGTATAIAAHGHREFAA